MMRFTPLLLPFAVVLLGLSAAPVSAQFQPVPYNQPQYGVGYRPQLSPYLNLLRGGNTAANYYLGVVPEFERRQNRETFQNALSRIDEQLNKTVVEEDLAVPLGGTGHVTAFGNTGGYFGSLTGRTAGTQQQQRPATPATSGLKH